MVIANAIGRPMTCRAYAARHKWVDCTQQQADSKPPRLSSTMQGNSSASGWLAARILEPNMLLVLKSDSA